MYSQNNEILVVGHDPFYPIIGGGALRTLKVALELKKRGNKIKLFGPSEVKDIEGIPVFSIPKPRKVRSQILSAIKFNVRLLYKLFRFGKNSQLVFVHNTIAMPAVLLFSWITNKKVILDMTDIHAEYLKVGKINILEKIMRPFLLWIEYFMINRAKKIIVVTDTMKRHLINHKCNPKKISVVYDGADIKKFSPEKEDGAIYNIVHLGTVDKQHGVHYIPLAAEYIVKKFPTVKFYIIGEGRELRRVKRIVLDKGLKNNFIFLGYQNHFEIHKYLKRCAIGIIPRPDSLPNRLVITLKLPEYWASGTAVVASRLKGIEEVAKDKENIIFFEPDNYLDLAEKISYLLENPLKIAMLAQNGLETVKSFDWSILICKIVDIVEYEISTETKNYNSDLRD